MCQQDSWGGNIAELFLSDSCSLQLPSPVIDASGARAASSSTKCTNPIKPLKILKKQFSLQIKPVELILIINTGLCSESDINNE